VFGWFASTSPLYCRSSHAAPAQRQWLQTSPRHLARQLPRLGCVLYTPTRAVTLPAEPIVAGVLLARPELAPLLQTRWLAAVGAITGDGPREWLECLDGQGQLHARLHLLPDTDYLAWDALLQAAGTTAPDLLPRQRRGFRPAGAYLVAFRHSELGGLDALDAVPACAVSGLGKQIAQRIAKDEAVALQDAS
jgi:hypothetical protein